VFILVTVNAQQFPVAAVGRIVIVIVVFVMDRELFQFLALNSRPHRPQIGGNNLSACSRYPRIRISCSRRISAMNFLSAFGRLSCGI